jgi:hypothetical protein
MNSWLCKFERCFRNAGMLMLPRECAWKALNFIAIVSNLRFGNENVCFDDFRMIVFRFRYFSTSRRSWLIDQELTSRFDLRKRPSWPVNCEERRRIRDTKQMARASFKSPLFKFIVNKQLAMTTGFVNEAKSWEINVLFTSCSFNCWVKPLLIKSLHECKSASTPVRRKTNFDDIIVDLVNNLQEFRIICNSSSSSILFTGKSLTQLRAKTFCKANLHVI